MEAHSCPGAVGLHHESTYCGLVGLPGGDQGLHRQHTLTDGRLQAHSVQFEMWDWNCATCSQYFLQLIHVMGQSCAAGVYPHYPL